MTSLAGLIKKATAPAPPQTPSSVSSDSLLTVDESVLKAIKATCKVSEESVKQAFYYLVTDLAKRNKLVRIRALVVMDCLLHRSKLFRELACADIRTIVEHMDLLWPDLQQPNGVASPYTLELQAKGKQLVETWDYLYGEKYPQLRAVARYLRETLQLDMPNIVENARLLMERGQRNQAHVRNLINLQYQQIIRSEWNFYMIEWRRSVTRLEEMFSLLFPGIGGENVSKRPSCDGEVLVEENDVNWLDEDDMEIGEDAKTALGEDYSEPTLESIGAPYTLTISLATSASELENTDNAILLQHVREISRHLVTSAVPRLQRWRSVLTRAVALQTSDKSDASVGAPLSTGDTETAASTGVRNIVPNCGISSINDGRSSGIEGVIVSGSLLGKRRVEDDFVAEGAADFVSNLPAVPESAAQRLSEVDAFLGELRVLLTGKVRNLLRGEAVSVSVAAQPSSRD